MPKDWTSMSICNTGGDTKEDKAFEESHTDMAV